MTRTVWKVFLGMMQVLATERKPCRFRLMQMWTRHTSGRCTARTRSEYNDSVWLLHVCLVLVSFDIAITIAWCKDHKVCRGVMQCTGIAGNQQAVNCWPASTEKFNYLLVRYNHTKALSRSILGDVMDETRLVLHASISLWAGKRFQNVYLYLYLYL